MGMRSYQIKNYRWEVPVAVRYDLNNQTYVQDYLGHVKDILIALKKYIDIYYNLIKNFCIEWDIDFKFFFKALFLKAYYHDIGMLSLEFQRNIASNFYDRKLSHKTLGLPLFKLLYDNNHYEGFDKEIHWNEFLRNVKHTEDYRSILKLDKNYFIKYDRDRIISYSVMINYFYNTVGFDKYFILKFNTISDIPSTTVEDLNNFFENLNKERGAGEDLKERIMNYFIDYIISTLDFIVRANFLKILKKNQVDFPVIYGSVFKSTYKFFMPKFHLNLRQLKLNKQYRDSLSKSTMYSAITAFPSDEMLKYGLLWAKKNDDESGRGRVLIVNSLSAEEFVVSRIKNYVSRSVNVYVFNSFLKGIEASFKDPYYYDLFNDILKGSVFFYSPVSIIDLSQLFESCLMGDNIENSLGNLQHTSIVFLGVPLYSKDQMKLFLALIKFLSTLKIPYLIFNMGFPTSFMKKLMEINPLIRYQEIEAIKTYKPFTIIRRKGKLLTGKGVNQNFYKTLKKHFKQNRNQLVAFNTISSAQRFYFYLHEDFIKNNLDTSKIILKHPFFTGFDSFEKTRMIDNLKRGSSSITITIQRINLLPQIRFQHYYIETVPFDILSDWALYLSEKILLKKNKTHLNLEIFSSTGSTPYRSKALQNTSKLMTSGEITVAKLIRYTDSIYDNIIQNELNKVPDFLNEKDETESITGTIKKVNLVPFMVYNDKGSKISQGDTISIPLNLYKKLRVLLGKEFFPKHSKGDFILCQLPYSKEFGLVFPEDAYPEKYTI